MSGLNDRAQMDIIALAVMNELKTAVENKIVAKLVEDFQSQARELVRAELEKVTIAGIQQTMDIMRMREMLDVRINFGGGDVVSHTINRV